MTRWERALAVLTIVAFVIAITSCTALVLNEGWVTRLLGLVLAVVNGYNAHGVVRVWRLLRDRKRDAVLDALKEMP